MGKKVSPFAPDKTKYEKRVEERHTKYLEGIVAGKSKKKSALEAGYSSSTANTTKSVVDKTLIKKTTCELSAVDRYLPVEKVFGVVADGMNAVKTQRASYNGVFTDERVDVDHTTRLKSAEVAGKLRGMFTENVKVENVEKHILILPDNGRLND